VDPSAEGVATYQPNDPEDEKDDGDCPKHVALLEDRRILFPVRRDGIQHCRPFLW